MPLAIVREMWSPVGREIVAVEWSKTGEIAVLFYDEGEPERILASEDMAAQLAREIGLNEAVKWHGSVLWTHSEADSPPR